MTFPDWMPIWPLFSPVTLSGVSTVTALHLTSVARLAERSVGTRRRLVALVPLVLAPLLFPLGLGAETGCSDTGGSYSVGPFWYLGLVAIAPVVLALQRLYRAGGAEGLRPWNAASLIVFATVIMFIVEALLSTFSLLAVCDPGTWTLLIVQLGVAAVIPVVGLSARALAARGW